MGQQLSAVVYLSLALLQHYIDIGSASAIDSRVYYKTDAFERLTRYSPFLRDALENFYAFVFSFFYFEFYLSSMMLTMDIYVMVCHPFRHERFRSITNVLKWLLIGSGVCMFLAISDLSAGVFSLVHYLRQTPYSLDYQNVSLGLNITKTAVIATAKLAYAVAISRMGYHVFTSLNESSQMSGERRDSKSRMYRRLVCYCLLPQILNILFLVPEVFRLGRAISHYDNKDPCNESNVFRRKHLVLGINFGVFTFSSLSYHLAYLALFPSVRRAFLCK